MKSNYLSISVNGFRSINRADIHLNGITILSGINGSGKSTISKLVYCIVRSINNYESIVLSHFIEDIKPYSSTLFDLYAYTEAFGQIRINNWRSLRSAFRPKSFLQFSELSSVLKHLCDDIIEYSNNTSDLDWKRRSDTILNRTLRMDNYSNLPDAIDTLKTRIEGMMSKAEETVARRRSALINDEINKIFSERVEDSVTLREYGVNIFGKDNYITPPLHFIKNIFYIDSPLAIDSDEYLYDNWKDLIIALKKTKENNSNNSLSKYITKEIIHGEARYEEINSLLQSSFLFKDIYGNEFTLSKCATGIKSFSIIQLLIRGGLVNEDTLLILDEPEVHLHPQWIVEYARLIVLMHKQIGVKFLISSHSTDLVSSLRYISEKEKCLDNLEFYVSRKSRENKGRFNFLSSGINIEPIFKSFNRSYTRLDKYSFCDGEVQ